MKELSWLGLPTTKEGSRFRCCEVPFVVKRGVSRGGAELGFTNE